MPEVDYSEFFYHRELPPDDKLPQKEKLPREKKTGGSNTKTKKRKSPLFYFVVVLLLFAVLFFSVDFFTNGYLIDKISATLKGNNYEYFLVVSEKSSRELAYAHSLLVKQGGGSGFLIQEGNYLIVYSIHMDKGAANVVSGKNPSTFVHPISYDHKDAEFFNHCDEVISTLITYSEKLEAGAITESEMLGAITNLKNKTLLLKDARIGQNISAFHNLLDLITGSLDSLNLSTVTRVSFLSDIRYATAAILISMEAIATS